MHALQRPIVDVEAKMHVTRWTETLTTVVDDIERRSGCMLGYSHPAPVRLPCHSQRYPLSSRAYFHILPVTKSSLALVAEKLVRLISRSVGTRARRT